MLSRRQLLFTMAVFGSCRPLGVTAPVMKPAPENQRCVIAAITKGASGSIEIQVGGAVELPVQNELPALRIGNVESRLGRYPDSGDIHHLIFSFEPADFAAMPDGAEALLYYGDPSDARRWECGRLDKRSLK